MGFGLLYIFTEWNFQSHLSTSDMGSSASGLRWVRRFRWLTSPYRDAVHFAIETAYTVRLGAHWLFHRPCNDDGRAPNESNQARRSLKWTKKITCTRLDHDHHGTRHPDTPLPIPASPMRAPAPAATAAATRSRSSSQAPILLGQDLQGSPLHVDTRIATPTHIYQTPRSSYEVGSSDDGSPTNLRVPRRPSAYERQASSGSRSHLDNGSPTSETRFMLA